MDGRGKYFAIKVLRGILFPFLKASLPCLFLAGCVDTPAVGIPGIETDNLLPNAAILSPPAIADPDLQVDSTASLSSNLFSIGAEITFRGIGFDPEDDSLSAGSLRWSSSIDGKLGTGAVLIKSDLSAGIHWVFLTATDSQGATARDSVRIIVGERGTAINLQPIATIITDGLNLVDGVLGLLIDDKLILEGTGNDPEGGDVALNWSSNLDGYLGTGQSLNVTGLLSLGSHTITLTAIDSLGAAGSDSIQVSIKEAVSNMAPVVEILTDELNLINDVLYTLTGEPLTLKGTGTDENTTLSDTSLVWINALGEELSRGSSLNLSDLSTGLHTVILTATDSQGATGRDSINISIEEPESEVGQAPAAPTNLRAETGLLDILLGLVKVDLSWQDNSDNETLFRIEHRLLGLGEFKLSAIVDANTTSESISGLLAGSTYEFRIRAENKYGTSEYRYITY